MKTFLLTMFFSGMLLIYSVHAVVINVPESFSSIQEGINAARDGDVVVVAPGTYTEHIKLKENIKLQGSGIDKSIIQGVDFNPVVYGANYCKIEAFTITSKSEYPGFGIYCNHTSPTITNVRITKTKWGIGCYFASPKIINNIIEENYVEGIHSVASYPDIIENKILNNGDGIYCSFCFSLLITKNIIKGNRYTGIYSIHSSPTIKSNEIENNGYQNLVCNVFSIPILRENSIMGKTYYNIELYNNKELIDAKKNFWGETVKKKIEEKIWDNNDDRKLGKVQFEPWLGVGVSSSK